MTDLPIGGVEVKLPYLPTDQTYYALYKKEASIASFTSTIALLGELFFFKFENNKVHKLLLFFFLMCWAL